MTQAEKIDKAMSFVSDAIPASLGLTILAVLFVLFFATEIFSDASCRLMLGTVLVIEVIVLLFLAVFAFYLRVYLPLHGVA